VWVSKLKFNDSTEITFSNNDIVVIVGPNNSGKSATLKEISKLFRQKAEKGKVLVDIDFDANGDQDIVEFLDSFSTKTFGGNPEPQYAGFGFSIYGGSVRNQWQSYKNGLGALYPIFVSLLNTEERLSAANPPSTINLISQAAQHPIHFLQKDDNLEKRFSEYFRQAFGKDLVVHRNAGSNVPLYVGKKPIPKKGEDRVSTGYLQELEKLDLLHEQGDGMRSFVGVLLNSFVANNSVILLDEPEAFLHPPQARLLGKMLAKDLPSERQLFLSTHSEDFLKGLLDSEIGNLKIIRITRENSTNHVSVLDSSEIKEIWQDSLLRHSNILNGLFHSRVIICESDSDCRFFSAVLAAVFDNTEAVAPDLLFLHCGGKHRIPVVIKALMKLKVSIRVIADFDILNEGTPLKEIVNELNGSWPKIEKKWKLIKSEIESKRPELLSSELKKQVDEVFSSSDDRIFSRENVRKIEGLLKKSSAWSEAKAVGKPYIPSGNATAAFDEFQSFSHKLGLFVLEVGELECFVRSVGNHGPKWVNEVLQRDLKTDPELSVARDFVKRLIE
jgi:predicted ATPase